MARPALSLIAIVALSVGSLAAPAARSKAPAKPQHPSHPAAAYPAAEHSTAVSHAADHSTATHIKAHAPSGATAELIDWVFETGDNKDLPFIVIDKVAAELYIFKSSGRNFQQTPVLVGIAKGDRSAPGIGDKELSKIPVGERTTPAGRFQAFFGPADGYKKDILWVDYATSISLHPVITSNPAEHRVARLHSPSPKDNRITFGCINVDPQFYKTVIEPIFREHGGIVYILPEERPLSAVFAGFPADEPRAALPSDQDTTGS